MIISNTFNVLFGHEFYKASLTIYHLNLMSHLWKENVQKMILQHFCSGIISGIWCVVL